MLVATLSALLLLAPVRSASAEGQPSTSLEHVQHEPAAPLTITYDEAVRRAAQDGPQVQLARAPVAAAVDAKSAADRALLYNPRLSVEAGRRHGPFGVGPDIAVSVMQDLPLSGVGAERRSVASALSDSVGAELDRVRLSAAALGAEAWIASVEARELFRLRSASLAEAQKAVAMARARVKSGEGQPLELALAEGDRASVAAAVIDAEGMLTEAKAELRYVLGLPPEQAVEASGALRMADEDVDERGAVRAVEGGHPAVESASAKARLAYAQARLAGASVQQPLSVGGSFRHEGSGERIWSAMVSVPLPFLNTGAFDQAMQQAEAASAGAQTEVIKAQLARDIRLALHDRHHYRELRDSLEGGAIGPLGEALRLAQVQLSAGTVDAAPVIVARQRLLGVQEQIVRAEAQIRRADLKLNELTGALVRDRRLAR